MQSYEFEIVEVMIDSNLYDSMIDYLLFHELYAKTPIGKTLDFLERG